MPLNRERVGFVIVGMMVLVGFFLNKNHQRRKNNNMVMKPMTKIIAYNILYFNKK